MKRLFRRPIDSSNSSSIRRPNDSCDAIQSEIDLIYSSYEREVNSIVELDQAVEKQEQREARRMHHRAWSLESDFRISRGDETEVAEACWMPRTSSMNSLAGSMARLAPSQSFLSTASLTERNDQPAMPSWPSSIFCRQDDVTSIPSPIRPEIQHLDIVIDTPRRDERIKEIPLSVHSPLSIDSAIQVDEFGRIIVTSSGALGASPQLHFHDTSVEVIPSALPVSIVSSTSVQSLLKTSRDTFGNNSNYVHYNEMKPSFRDAEVIESSVAFEVHPGTPLPARPTTMMTWDSEHCNGKMSQPSLADGQLLCFPNLCQAASALSNLQEGPDELCWTNHTHSDSALLSPIELTNEKPLRPYYVDVPKAFDDNKHFAPWRSSRQVGLSTSKSDTRLIDFKPTKTLTSLARAESNIDFTKGWNHMATHAQAFIPISFPNPHSSPDLSTVQEECDSYTVSALLSPSDGATIASVESSASVRCIIDQQRTAMEKLAQAGFWHQKISEKKEKDKEEDRMTHLQLPCLLPEDIVSKVSQWAWLLSSETTLEAERDQGDGDRVSLTMSSPIHYRDEEQEESESKRSWEWLTSEEDFEEDSLESNETILHFSRTDNALNFESKQDSSLDRNVIDAEGNDGCEEKEDTSIEDSFTVNTPELGQRESRTTAAIEALLSQIQVAQYPALSKQKDNVTRKVGTSYLYHQILKNIAEEDDQNDKKEG